MAFVERPAAAEAGASAADDAVVPQGCERAADLATAMRCDEAVDGGSADYMSLGFFRHLAVHGFGAAAYQLALLLADNEAMAPSADADPSVQRLLRIAAAEGHRGAAWHLARRLHLGLGTAVEPEEANIWYRRAADAGSARAAAVLAQHLHLGVFCKRDATGAVAYGLQVAEAGEPRSGLLLG